MRFILIWVVILIPMAVAYLFGITVGKQKMIDEVLMYLCVRDSKTESQLFQQYLATGEVTVVDR